MRGMGFTPSSHRRRRRRRNSNNSPGGMDPQVGSRSLHCRTHTVTMDPCRTRCTRGRYPPPSGSKAQLVRAWHPVKIAMGARGTLAADQGWIGETNGRVTSLCMTKKSARGSGCCCVRGNAIERRSASAREKDSSWNASASMLKWIGGKENTARCGKGKIKERERGRESGRERRGMLGLVGHTHHPRPYTRRNLEVRVRLVTLPSTINGQRTIMCIIIMAHLHPHPRAHRSRFPRRSLHPA